MNELDLLKQFRNNVSEPSDAAWVKARAAISTARAETADGAPARRGLRPLATRLRGRSRLWGRSLLRGRSLTALLGSTGAIAAAVAAAVVFTAGSTPSVAFAGWTADPTAPAGGQVAAGEAECQHNSTLASLTPVVTDTRGPYTLLVYTLLLDARRSTVLCITGPSIEGPPTRNGPPRRDLSFAGGEAIRNGKAIPTTTTVAADAIQRILIGGLTTRATGGLSFDVGRVGEGVTAVTFVLEDGTRVEATTANGWYAAWWPTDQSAQTAGQTAEIEITTTEGTTTEPFEITTTGTTTEELTPSG